MDENPPDDPFVCAGCGTPLALNEYRSCDCPTAVGFRRSDFAHIVKKDCCAWCKAVPTHANIDGDELCFGCCNKWAQGEGLAMLAERTKGTSYD